MASDSAGDGTGMCAPPPHPLTAQRMEMSALDSCACVACVRRGAVCGAAVPGCGSAIECYCETRELYNFSNLCRWLPGRSTLAGSSPIDGHARVQLLCAQVVDSLGPRRWPPPSSRLDGRRRAMLHTGPGAAGRRRGRLPMHASGEWSLLRKIGRRQRRAVRTSACTGGQRRRSALRELHERAHRLHHGRSCRLSAAVGEHRVQRRAQPRRERAVL